MKWCDVYVCRVWFYAVRNTCKVLLQNLQRSMNLLTSFIGKLQGNQYWVYSTIMSVDFTNFIVSKIRGKKPYTCFNEPTITHVSGLAGVELACHRQHVWRFTDLYLSQVITQEIYRHHQFAMFHFLFISTI